MNVFSSDKWMSIYVLNPLMYQTLILILGNSSVLVWEKNGFNSVNQNRIEMANGTHLHTPHVFRWLSRGQTRMQGFYKRLVFMASESMHFLYLDEEARFVENVQYLVPNILKPRLLPWQQKYRIVIYLQKIDWLKKLGRLHMCHGRRTCGLHEIWSRICRLQRTTSILVSKDSILNTNKKA